MPANPNNQGQPTRGQQSAGRSATDSTGASTGGRSTADDDLDFVVTEASEEKRDLAGGYVPEAKNDASTGEIPTERDDRPVRPKSQPMYNPLDDDDDVIASAPPLSTQTKSDTTDTTTRTGSKNAATDDASSTGRIRKLTHDEIKNIEKNLYKSSSYLSDEERSALLKNVDAADARASQVYAPPSGAVKPETPAKQDSSHPQGPVKPRMSDRVRGVAFFTSNFVQLVGAHELREGDELTINDRLFVLKKKRVSSRTLIAILSPIVAVVLFLIGIKFIAGSPNGNGTVVGIALDDLHQPFIQGAQIEFPDLGMTVTTNGEGWFKANQVPPGSHKVRYLIGGSVVGEDFVTVIAGEITSLSLEPSEISEPVESKPRQNEQSNTVVPTQRQSTPTEPQPKRANQREAETPAGSDVPVNRASTGTIVLAANVDGARFTLDGTTMGSGNLNYRKIAPGKHNYTVSKDGYITAAGTVEIIAGQTVRLDATLGEQPIETPEYVQHYQAGTRAYEGGDHTTALNELTEAIAQQPSYADAYVTRAGVYKTDRNVAAAFDDYLKAAELMASAKDYNAAIHTYTLAIETKPTEVSGYLGRASLFMQKGDAIAAVADYEQVIRTDRHVAAAHAGLGKVRLNQGNYERAIKHLKDARSLDPDDARVTQDLMLAYYGDGDIKNLRKTYDIFVKSASPEQVERFRKDRANSAVVALVDRNIVN